jgi:adenylyltransferase/sulfurtransferase
VKDYDLERYKRQIALDGWGERGQAKLASASVFIAGAGGLGSMVAYHLAAAGVGTLRIADCDRVELSNLNRQVLHSDARIGMSKALSAEQTLTAFNPSIKIIAEEVEITAANIAALASQPDLVIDCLDNFETRLVLNEYCCGADVPLIHAGLWGFTGQVTFIHPPETPCLRCIFPRSLPKTITPIVGAIAGVIGAIQAMEALKYLTGIGTLLKGKMLCFDGNDISTNQLPLQRDRNCRVCGGLVQAQG